MRKVSNRALVALVAYVVSATFSTSTAFASVIAQAISPTQSVTTVAFKVAPERTTTGTATGVLSYTTGSANDSFYYYYVNNGTITVNRFTWSYTKISGLNGTLISKVCPVNTTFSSPTLCSNSSTPITTTPGTGPALNPGDFLPVYIQYNKKNAVFQAGSTVAASDIRAGINSVA